MYRLKTMLSLVALLAALPLGSAPVGAQAGATDAARNLESVRTLIEQSSAAKRIEASGNSAALAKREEARKLYEHGRAALEGGDEAKAAELLSESKKTMFRAVQLAGAGQVGVDKAKKDFEKRAASVQALAQAQGRVIEEKHAGAEERRAHAEAEALLAKAQSQYEAGQYKDGIASLDGALDKLRTSIEHMRGGDTLENRIEFKTKADEYEYYRGKIESQLEAIRLAQANVAGTPKEAQIVRFADKMEQAHKDAQRLAERGEYQRAIDALEPIFKQAPFQLMSILR